MKINAITVAITVVGTLTVIVALAFLTSHRPSWGQAGGEPGEPPASTRDDRGTAQGNGSPDPPPTVTKSKIGKVLDESQESDDAAAGARDGRVPGRVRFGAASGRKIDEVESSGGQMLDLDSGDFYTPAGDDPNAAASPRDVLRKAIEGGADVYYENAGEGRTLYGMDMLAMPFADWAMNNQDDDTAEQVRSAIRSLEEFGDPGTPVLLSGRGNLPVTYIFVTSEGGRGVLQIVGFEGRAAAEVRFKLINRVPVEGEEK